jgi:hypothetical protein
VSATANSSLGHEVWTSLLRGSHSFAITTLQFFHFAPSKLKNVLAFKRFIDWAINNLKMAEEELLALQRSLQQLKKVHPESLKFEEAIAEKYDSFLASSHAQEAQDVSLGRSREVPSRMGTHELAELSRTLEPM